MVDQDLLIPERDWRKLLAAASGDGALLYLFLRAGGSPEQAEAALRFTKPRMECAVASSNSWDSGRKNQRFCGLRSRQRIPKPI